MSTIEPWSGANRLGTDASSESPVAPQRPVAHGGAAGSSPQVEVTCGFCRGTGKMGHGACQVCGGRGVKMLRAPVARCKVCQGRGRARGAQLTCGSCNGVGQVSIPEGAVNCPACGGSGRNKSFSDSPMPCAPCRGKGVVAPRRA